MVDVHRNAPLAAQFTVVLVDDRPTMDAIEFAGRDWRYRRTIFVARRSTVTVDREHVDLERAEAAVGAGPDGHGIEVIRQVEDEKSLEKQPGVSASHGIDTALSSRHGTGLGASLLYQVAWPVPNPQPWMV